MSKKTKLRLLDMWYITKMFEAQILHGYEVHAGRWIADRIIWQSACAHRGKDCYLWVCQNGRYKTDPDRQAREDLWKL